MLLITNPTLPPLTPLLKAAGDTTYYSKGIQDTLLPYSNLAVL